MKKILFIATIVATSMFTSCDSTGNPDQPTEEMSAKELALQKATIAYIDNTVVPTYKGMADAAIELAKTTDQMLIDFKAGKLETSLIKKAGDQWREARKYWEQSEAFLFGAAADYNIDPHIDSWPLDQLSMENMLANEEQMAQMSVDYVANNLGYGLLGFHAVEYMIFELDETGTKSQPRSINKYTENELIYLAAVAGDLRNQCIRLEASWAGIENVTTEKSTILIDAELEPGRNYGLEMKNAGQAGSLYVNYQATAEELIQGCMDIADEVGNMKIGRPVNGSEDGDRSYIESPYALNSIEDFANNIISIQNAYQGSKEGDASVSDYIKSVDAELDELLKNQLKEAYNLIKSIPEPFTATAQTDENASKAVEFVGTTIVETLEQVMATLSQY